MKNNFSTKESIKEKKNFYFLGVLFFLLIISEPFNKSYNGAILLFTSIIVFFNIYGSIFEYLPKKFLYFLIYNLVYLFFSLLNLFPKSWTKYYEISAIPQQSFIIFLFPLLFIFFNKKFNEKSFQDDISFANSILILAVVHRIIIFYFFSPNITNLDFLKITTLNNFSSLFIVSFFLYMHYIKNKFINFLILIIFFYLSYISPYSQNLLLATAILPIWLFPRYSKIIIIGFISTILISYLYFFLNLEIAKKLDINFPIRIIFAYDIILALKDTYFIGVGYGTESLTNYYEQFNIFNFMSDYDEKFIFMTPHNSFLTIMFRTGIIGLFLFIFFLKYCFDQIYLDVNNLRLIKLKSSLFLSFFTLIFFNPGLEGIAYILSASLYLSLVYSNNLK